MFAAVMVFGRSERFRAPDAVLPYGGREAAQLGKEHGLRGCIPARPLIQCSMGVNTVKQEVRRKHRKEVGKIMCYFVLTGIYLCGIHVVMKYKSTLLAQASGSLAGATFSRNKGGPYIRSRVMPTNKNSDPQSDIKAAMGALSNVFGGLTSGERISWEGYAAAINMIDRLGESRKISAINHFIRCNLVRVLYHTANAILRTAPSETNIGATPIFYALTATYKSAGLVTIAGNLNITDAPAGADSNSLALFFGSPCLNQSIFYYKGPFLYFAQDGLLTSGQQPQPFSHDLAGAWNPLGGDKAFIRVEMSRSDGRLSQSVIASVLTVPPP